MTNSQNLISSYKNKDSKLEEDFKKEVESHYRAYKDKHSFPWLKIFQKVPVGSILNGTAHISKTYNFDYDIKIYDLGSIFVDCIVYGLQHVLYEFFNTNKITKCQPIDFNKSFDDQSLKYYLSGDGHFKISFITNYKGSDKLISNDPTYQNVINDCEYIMTDIKADKGCNNVIPKGWFFRSCDLDLKRTEVETRAFIPENSFDYNFKLRFFTKFKII